MRLFVGFVMQGHKYGFPGETNTHTVDIFFF